jgi:predicted GNAT family acetyltransferase
MDELPIEFEATEKGGRYFVATPGGEDARLTFVRVSDTHWIADHTFVPVPWRGKGIAERMVVRLVDDARKTGVKITPTCWFVADELQRMSPQWDDVWMR